MHKVCEACGAGYESKRASSRTCSERCRKQLQRKPAAPARKVTDLDAVPTEVADALRIELEHLQVAHLYEARIALGIATQLDNGTVAGAAYATLSKELDRRVEALRLKVERPDDPAKSVKDRLAEKRLRLA